MRYNQFVLPFPPDTESFCFPTNMWKRGDTTVCYLLVPSFPQGMRLEQQLHIFVAPAGTSLCPPVLCHSPIKGQHTSATGRHVLWAKNEIQGGKKAFLWWGWSNSGTDQVASLWSLHPPRNWKPSWTLLWATSGSCLCLEQGLGWILSRDAFLPQLACAFCIKKLGIPHLNCYTPMKNEYQCLRIPKHFTAFYFSVGTARNVMLMAREVINYPLLQQMI